MITYKMLIVDDYPVQRTGLWVIVSILSGFEVCGFAKTKSEAVSKAKELNPDLASVDLNTSPEDQTECIRALHRVNPELPILALSAEDEDNYKQAWLDAGAAHEVRKDGTVAKIAEGLLEVMKASGVEVDESAIAPRVTGSLADWPEYDSNALGKLSARELEVFDVLGSGKTTKETADLLSVSEKTVESHRESIKTKLDIDSFTKFMRHAVEWHLLRTQPEPSGD